MALFLAIDLGTTGCRSMVIEDSLRQLSGSYMEYPLFTPQKNWVEQNAEDWWRCTVETAKQAIFKAGVDADQIDAISVSSQGITFVPVDRELKPLCRALTWLDGRAEEQTQWIKQSLGELDMFRLTGKPVLSCYMLPKLLWLRDNAPYLFRTAWKYLMPLDYLMAKLTGRCITDHTMASGTLMYDIRNHCWSSQVLQACGIDPDKLPELLWSGANAGPLCAQAAAELGLREDCVVAVGAQDQRCASLGAGLADGVMTVSLGTAAAICKLWKAPPDTDDMRIGWSAYLSDTTWVTEGVLSTAATCLRWVRDTMFPGADYTLVSREASEAHRHGSRMLFYPYMSGPTSPDNYPDATGCFYGVDLGAKRGDFALAVMEGVAFQIRILLEAMNAYPAVREIVLFGGGAKSDIWPQIIADVTGLTVRIPQSEEAGVTGAAILAGIASGHFHADIPPALPIARTIHPSDRRENYAKQYADYRSIEKKLWAQGGTVK